MEKLNLNDLEKLRKTLKPDQESEIIVSMGTCGIAAGGDDIFAYFMRELEKRGLSQVRLKKTGCLGLCSVEPNVIVKTKALPAILYGNVTRDVAVRILEEHIKQNQILNDYVLAMPSEDIYCPCDK
jgi:(2Fe-2S) ferredoxin